MNYDLPAAAKLNKENVLEVRDFVSENSWFLGRF